LLEVRENERSPADEFAGGVRGRGNRPPAGWEAAAGGFKRLKSQPELAQVILASGAAGGFAGLLDSGEKEADQRADDGDDDEKLNEGERAAVKDDWHAGR
jgi:hypothetical protein